ncbi:hypothetical protein ACH4NF_35285 [Streptomyces sp. NPDC017248]|uniref:hypothetical protein n=1 Tax=unclassified Streptomyces TaxID=2593676 RepID=UPI0037BA6250
MTTEPITPGADRTFALSPEELARFREQGFLGPFKVYEIEEMKDAWRKERLR